MKSVLVYDQNNLESILAAACAVSTGGHTACEIRSFPPEADQYLWVGCVPTEEHVRNDPTIRERVHIVFADLVSKKSIGKFVIPNVTFYHSVEDQSEKITADRTYGKVTLIERVLSFLQEDLGKFVRPIMYAKEFYSVKASEDLLHEIALNVKEALFCLKSQKEVYMPISITGAEEDAFRAYKDLIEIAKSAIDHRSHRAWFTTQHKERVQIFTFYEQENWWFTRRRLWLGSMIHRNITMSATGTMVSTNAQYLEALPQRDPVFLY